MQYAFSLQLSTLLYMYTYFVPLNVINMGLYKAGVRNCVEVRGIAFHLCRRRALSLRYQIYDMLGLRV